ncbi:MAG: DUF1127 domain-containing protein [Pseudomonadota bacterium]
MMKGHHPIRIVKGKTMTVRTHNSPLAIRGTQPRKGFARFIFSILRLGKSRQDLRKLDDHLLRDLGITREEAKKEADRPIWDVPANWRH